jgi:hypothetical protein
MMGVGGVAEAGQQAWDAGRPRAKRCSVMMGGGYGVSSAVPPDRRQASRGGGLGLLWLFAFLL